MKRSGVPRRKAAIGRSPLRHLRKDRTLLALVRFHDEVERRAAGRCQVGLQHDTPDSVVTMDGTVWTNCRGWGDQAHHIVPRSRGVGWVGLHEPENGLWVCAPCHAWIHANPQMATNLGLLASAPR